MWTSRGLGRDGAVEFVSIVFNTSFWYTSSQDILWLLKHLPTSIIWLPVPRVLRKCQALWNAPKTQLWKFRHLIRWHQKCFFQEVGRLRYLKRCLQFLPFFLFAIFCLFPVSLSALFFECLRWLRPQHRLRVFSLTWPAFSNKINETKERERNKHGCCSLLWNSSMAAVTSCENALIFSYFAYNCTFCSFSYILKQWVWIQSDQRWEKKALYLRVNVQYLALKYLGDTIFVPLFSQALYGLS